MLHKLVISAATIGLSAALVAAQAIADHKEKPHGRGGGGGGGGDANYLITLTDVTNGVVADGDGVEGPGGTIDGIPESFPDINLGLISTKGGTSDVASDYNDACSNVNAIGPTADIDDIRVVPNPEINDLTVVVEYTVDTQSFILLLQGPLPDDFPPTTTTETYDLTMWNNRGGGKGKRNRCGSGTQVLDGVTLEIDPQSP